MVDCSENIQQICGINMFTEHIHGDSKKEFSKINVHLTCKAGFCDGRS